MWLFRALKLGDKRKKNSKTENYSRNILEPGVIKMDRVDKIETLVSMEKEIMGYRKELCQELLNMSKGKW